MTTIKRAKRQTMVSKKLHRKLTFEQPEAQLKPGLRSDAPDELAIPVPTEAPVVLLM